MFKVTFVKSIWDAYSTQSSKTLATLKREETLPFAPMPGMEISWNGVTHQLATVRWNASGAAFVCMTKDEFPQKDSEDFDFEGLVRFSLNRGWLLASKDSL